MYSLCSCHMVNYKCNVVFQCLRTLTAKLASFNDVWELFSSRTKVVFFRVLFAFLSLLPPLLNFALEHSIRKVQKTNLGLDMIR